MIIEHVLFWVLSLWVRLNRIIVWSLKSLPHHPIIFFIQQWQCWQTFCQRASNRSPHSKVVFSAIIHQFLTYKCITAKVLLMPQGLSKSKIVLLILVIKVHNESWEMSAHWLIRPHDYDAAAADDDGDELHNESWEMSAPWLIRPPPHILPLCQCQGGQRSTLLYTTVWCLTTYFNILQLRYSTILFLLSLLRWTTLYNAIALV